MRMYDYITRFNVNGEKKSITTFRFKCQYNCMEQTGYALQEVIRVLDSLYGMTNMLSITITELWMNDDGCNMIVEADMM